MCFLEFFAHFWSFLFKIMCFLEFFAHFWSFLFKIRIVPTMLNFQNFVKTCVFWSFLLVFCSKSKSSQHAKFPEFCQNMCFFTFLNKKVFFFANFLPCYFALQACFFRDFQKKKQKNDTLIYSRENYFLRSKMCQKNMFFSIFSLSLGGDTTFFIFSFFFQPSILSGILIKIIIFLKKKIFFVQTC